MSSKLIIDSALRAAVNLPSSTIPSNVARTSAAWLSSVSAGGAVTLPDLPYDYNALEPVISAEIMEIHHTKHHNAYVTNLNVAVEKMDAALTAGNVSAVIALQGALKFNGGGHINHTLFWENCTSNCILVEVYVRFRVLLVAKKKWGEEVVARSFGFSS